MSTSNTSYWQTLCLQSRQQLRRGAVLQTRLRAALQCVKHSTPHMTGEEAEQLHVLLEKLAHEIAELCRMSSAQPSREDVAPALLHRAASLEAEISKLRLTVTYLAHQLAAATINTLATASVECHEPLSVAVCVLARELGAVVVPEPGAGAAGEKLLLYRNTCPSLLFPARRLTLTRVLQLTASYRAETASRNLLATLLASAPPSVRSADVEQDPCRDVLVRGNSVGSLESGNESGNSSLEVARELLQYASPPRVLSSAPDVLGKCVAAEQRLPACLLVAARTHAPQLAGPAGGTLLAQRDSRSKVLTYYRQLLWGDAGTLADHVLLWWLRPLGPVWCGRSVLRWLRHQVHGMREEARTTVNALCEALATHHATVSWDALFRKALVVPSGVSFGKLLHSLVVQVQSGEAGPAVEQIPLLHRLDHSLHTYRLWILAAARNQISAWRVTHFVDISQNDVDAVNIHLHQLSLNEQYQAPPIECVHETVCAKMRCKLVSEVKVNITKLQQTPDECIQVMAAVCRTVSLANLHMCFPDRRYWRQDGALPQFASSYVQDYLERVLRPVLVAVASRPSDSQHKVAGMALRILCEAWLDHIYQLRIHFSEWGALQLLADFGAVPTWLQERAGLSAGVERHLVRSEVLRRCEGVGRLLLRRPGESLHLKTPARQTEDSTPATPVKDSMPAEMYVPNQEKWLQLRATRRGPQVATALLCCR